MIWKRDSLVQAWVDRRDLATCTLALLKLEYHPRNPSEVIALVLRVIAEQQDRVIETAEEAIEVLNRLGFTTNLNPSGRGLGKLTANLIAIGDRIASGEMQIDEDELEKEIRKHIKEF